MVFEWFLNVKNDFGDHFERSEAFLESHVHFYLSSSVVLEPLDTLDIIKTIKNFSILECIPPNITEQLGLCK